MSSVADDTIGGFNRFLDDQRKVPGSATITLHQFDDVFETPLKAQDIKSAPGLTSATFVPRGNTALLDAIGRAIGETGSRLESATENDRAGKVVFVIITDGQENASHEYNQAKVFEMIGHQRDKYSWEFVFLGANQDAIKAASRVGISAANAISYAANATGVKQAFHSASSNLRSMRVGASASMAWSDEDRAKQRSAGATH